MQVLVPLESIDANGVFAAKIQYKLSSNNPADTGITEKDVEMSEDGSSKKD